MKVGRTYSLYPLMGSLYGLLLLSCVEEIAPEPLVESSPAVLVVDARLSDKPVVQRVYLTRSFDLGGGAPSPEAGAEVILEDELGNAIRFLQGTQGVYSSSTALTLLPDRRYRLSILTREGQHYYSEWEVLPEPNPITEVTAVRALSDTGSDGASIRVSTSGTAGEPSFFRYTYEETYQVVAPEYNPFRWDELDYDFFMGDDDGWEVTIAPREENVRVCYATEVSNAFNLAAADNTRGNGIEGHEIRFVGINNPIVTHRYSILVQQYQHSANAHSFYNTLEDFSETQDFFNMIQPGFLAGNLYSDDSDTPVLGYFELSSYSEKRIFFDFHEVFPGEPTPDYFIECDPIGKPALYPEGFHFTFIDGQLVLDGTSNSPLIDAILAGLVEYVGENPAYLETDAEGNTDRAPYLVKARGCVDCRAFGSINPPEFWID